jgi:two-component system, chemotaxis family, response regulator Rcp1
MNPSTASHPIEILLVEDRPGDIRLTQEVLKGGKVHNHLSVVEDGVQAIDFLNREMPDREAPQPDLILLDLNLPKKDEREVLELIKADRKLKRIPVIILTTSRAEEDIARAYDLHANCYIAKPIDLDQFIRVIKSIEEFWLTIVKLPSDVKLLPE